MRPLDGGLVLLVCIQLRADASQLPRDVADTAFVFGDFSIEGLLVGSIFDTLGIQGFQGCLDVVLLAFDLIAIGLDFCPGFGDEVANIRDGILLGFDV